MTRQSKPSGTSVRQSKPGGTVSRLAKLTGIAERLDLIDLNCGEFELTCGNEQYTCGGGYDILRVSKVEGNSVRQDEVT